MSDRYIAHIREEDRAVQTVLEHDENVAKLGAAFAVAPYKDVVYNAGILHDVGKYQQSFQRRIRGEKIRVDHSSCGAIAAKAHIKNPAALIIEYIIAGHHAGIPNGGTPSDMPGEGKNGATLNARLKKDPELDDYSAYKEDGLLDDLHSIDASDASRIANEIMKDCTGKNQLEEAIDKFAFVVRMCFSALVDADSLDTEHFCRRITRGTLESDFEKCLADIDQRLDSFENVTLLQEKRSVLQKQAYSNILKSGEIYMMNMPTGSGKTLCSTKCALLKASREHKKRIIYIIPYNSIINQTVEELSRIFDKDAHILRHQSTYSSEDDENLSDEDKLRIQQATENWDADIIVTTMVQFFETVFSNKKSKLRKMHNMADSVLIFDEVHLMPLKFLQPCLETIVYLTRYAGCNAIFLTATMPDYEQLLREYTFPDVKVIDLVPDKIAFNYFDKCIYMDIGNVTEETLFEMCEKSLSSLIVVNSRKKAKSLYGLLTGREECQVFHLSTYMTKADITNNIANVKHVLSEQDSGCEKRRLVVVSTSMIEAGVDLDFQTVFREYTGLDSILQSGGRCNREGKRQKGLVYVFGLNDGEEKENLRTMVTKSLFKEYDNISSPECVQQYFTRVFLTNAKEITQNSMHNYCHNFSSIPFADYDGKIIKSMEQSIVAPESEEAEQLVDQLRYSNISRKLVRQIQKYMCSVPLYIFNELLAAGVLDDYGTGIYVLTNMDYYDAATGICTEGRDYFI